MDTPTAPDTAAGNDRHRLLRAFNLSLGFVLLLVAMFAAQQTNWDWRLLTVAPHEIAGLPGLLGAPLLHGSIEHLAANATALLILGTLAGSVYPKATLRAWPLLWLGSGLGAWLLGEPGSHHLGKGIAGKGRRVLAQPADGHFARCGGLKRKEYNRGNLHYPGKLCGGATELRISFSEFPGKRLFVQCLFDPG